MVGLNTTTLFGLTIHLNFNFTVSQNIKLCGGIFLLLIIACIAFYLRKKRGLNNDLTDTSESGIINLTSARILLFFGAAILALSALAYAYVSNDYDDKLYLSFSLAIFLLVTAILSYVVEEIKKNISIILSAIYQLVSLYYVFLCYYSSLNPFFIICLIISLSLGTIIFEKTKHFVVFAIIIALLSLVITTTVTKPQFSISLFLIAISSILFVSIIATYVRLRLSDRLVFANTIINDGSSMVMAADKTGDVIYINKIFTKVLGFTEKEALGQGWWEIRNVLSEASLNPEKIRSGDVEGTTIVLLETKNKDKKWIQWNNTLLENGTIVGIGNDITERKLAEEKLKQHNADLSVINQVKEIVLSSSETANMYTKILLLLGNNSDKSHYFSVNIFDKYHPVLHTYSLSTTDYKVNSSTNEVDSELVNWLSDYKTDTIDFETNEEGINLYKNLHQPVTIYKSAVIFPIASAFKTYGFFGFFSLNKNAYTPDTAIMVKDICTSFASYFMQYEQNQIIENYSKQLEILNESKNKLITSNNLNDVYNGIIDLLSDNIENVLRVSILVHDLERNVGNLFFKDPETGEIKSKFISTKDVPTIPNHLKGFIYEKPDFENDPDLSEEDRIWMAKGARAVISLPITIKDNLFASVNLLSPVVNNFSDQHKALIKEINESAATVIEQLQFKEIISSKNKDISDNITYARRIQSALMPSEELLQELLPQSFLIFSQRDSLGGDFYWFEKRDENIFLAVGDCTGHGVSGSLLTILASDIIKQAVEGRGYSDPALILEYLSTSLQGALNKYSDNEILDGLDISFGIYNTSSKMLLFSSAIHHFFLARNNELIEYKGNRKAIGGANTNQLDNNFTTYMIQLESNDVIYFTTDGFTDQLESLTEKRYGKVRLKQMLLQINDKDLADQKDILIKEHLKWKGHQSQTDDICLLGFKV